jgi:acyl-CoA thioester hydrolase
MPQAFTTRRFVEFVDTDMAGIVHFSAFFRYMEAAEHELLRSLGLSVHTKLADDLVISFPRVSATCDYAAPARCEDWLDIAVTVERLGTKSITYGFAFTRAGEKIATGKMTAVCCQLVPGAPPKSIPLPTEIATPLQQFLK